MKWIPVKQLNLSHTVGTSFPPNKDTTMTNRESFVPDIINYPDFIEIDFLMANHGENFYNFTLYYYDPVSVHNFSTGKTNDISFSSIRTYTVITLFLNEEHINIQLLNSDHTRTNILNYVVDTASIDQLVEDFAVEIELEFGDPLPTEELMELKDDALKARVKSAIVALLSRCPYEYAQNLYGQWKREQINIEAERYKQAQADAKQKAIAELEAAKKTLH